MIRQLSEQLANQIAAGEVVERPASVVKELLENAIDAGAEHIICQVENAGRTLIRVQDDGEGIPHADLPLVFASHATSKIATLEDLEAICTLGFRGEALASIASVAKVTLTSRAVGTSAAYAVSCSGDPATVEIAPAAHPQGTSVEVRELFFNTPARRRFLRSDRTEFMRIRDVFVRCAVANPQRSFTLISDERTVIEVGKAPEHGEELRKRLAKLIGGDFNKDPLPCEYQGEILSLEGICLPPPSEHETIPEQIYLFLNGRPIADKLLTHAIKEAYASFSGRKSTVRCVLSLTCDPHRVDVNVHPRKDEVRFHEARIIHDTLADCIQNTLQQEDLSTLGQADKPSLPQETTSQYLRFIQEQQTLPDFPDGEGAFIPLPGSAKIMDGKVRMSSLQATVTEAEQKAAFSRQVAAENAVLKAKLVDPHLPKESCDFEILENLGQGRYFIRQAHEYFLLDAHFFSGALYLAQYAQEINEQQVQMVKLSIPVALKLGDKPAQTGMLVSAFERCGFTVQFTTKSLTLKAVPSIFSQASLPSLATKLLQRLSQYGPEILAAHARSDFFSGLEVYVPVPSLKVEELLHQAGDLTRYVGHPHALIHVSLDKLSRLLESGV